MKKIFLILIVVFLLPALSYTQSFADNLEFQAQAGLVKMSYGGEITNGDLGLGVILHTPKAVLEPSLVFVTNIDFSSATNATEIHIGIMPQVTIMQTMSLGFYYDF